MGWEEGGRVSMGVVLLGEGLGGGLDWRRAWVWWMTKWGISYVGRW